MNRLTLAGLVPYKPDYSFSLKPSPALLFHFSALTYNAHAIHFDPEFCRDEGHRGLLVHGPLSLTLLLTALRAQLRDSDDVKRIEYRNLAPLYAGEPMTVCLRRNPATADSGGKWDVWVEGPEGGLAVRGTAITASST